MLLHHITVTAHANSHMPTSLDKDTGFQDIGYPHDVRADKNLYPHDCHADKDSYPHDSNNQCIILRLQLSFAMINVQLMLV